MAKTNNKIKKNIKKAKENKKLKQNEERIPNEILTGLKILIGILIFIIVLVLITKFVNGDFKSNKMKISYSEIVAGQTFSRKEDTYYVVFYNYEGNDELTNTIEELYTSKKIYRVNLGDTINNKYLSSSSNKNATNTQELKINGTTLIKITDGKNVEYIEGQDEVSEYINKIQ